MDYTKLHDDDITKQELTEWKEKIGIPAQQQNEQLLINNEQLNEEIKTLQLQLSEYSIEISKLKTDKNDLSEELQQITQSNIGIKEQRNSLKHQDQVLETLQQYYEESQSQLKRDNDRIQELERENNQLKHENQQYELILDNLQREEASLKDKIHKESQQLRELKAKYEELNLEYHAEKSFSKHTSVVAQELQQEVNNMRQSYQHTLETINSDKKNGKHYSSQKTLRFDPQTLRLANVESDNFQKYFNIDSPNGMIAARQSMTWNSKRVELVNYDSTDRTNPIMSDDEDGQKYFQDVMINEMKEQLQMEYDEKLNNEKNKIIEKHKCEVNDLNKKMVKYKKQIVEKNTQIDRLKSEKLNGMKNRNTSFNTRPNNQQDSSKCKVFGTSWW